VKNIADPGLERAVNKGARGMGLTPDEGRTVANKILQTEQRLRRAYRTLKESEVQQAQVVLAAQDMVDQMQKMIEQVSSMQFKDLPALVDSIRNDVGMDQAQQFNNDSTAALQGLIQNLQSSKQQLETAQGTLTGQAPVVPGSVPPQDDMSAMPADTDLDVDADLSLDANLPADDEELPPAKALGRERR
jgi:hypothetical protein